MDQSHLFKVADTLKFEGLALRRGECGKQHGGKDRNDGDNHQEFNKRKPPSVWYCYAFNVFHMLFAYYLSQRAPDLSTDKL